MTDKPPPEIVDFYTAFAEESRLDRGASQIERVRTQDLITRVLPAVPADVVDVGGAAGAYAFWLAGLGYAVHLLDATPRLVAEARARNTQAAHPLASIAEGDARTLAFNDESADVVLLLGPLYHLPERGDRLAALREARRVLRTGGILIAAGISRYAAALDGLVFHPGIARHLVEMRHRAVADGQYRNQTADPRYFVTSYFHRPEDLVDELGAAGFRNARVFGVEGPAWLLPDFDARWNDAALRQDLLDVARLLEEEPSVRGISAHLLASASRS
jgi:SAM-dependent methyltransferase